MKTLKEISEEFDKLYPLYLSGTIEVSPDSVKDFFLSAFTEVLESLKGDEDSIHLGVRELNDKIKRIMG